MPPRLTKEVKKNFVTNIFQPHQLHPQQHTRYGFGHAHRKVKTLLGALLARTQSPTSSPSSGTTIMMWNLPPAINHETKQHGLERGLQYLKEQRILWFREQQTPTERITKEEQEDWPKFPTMGERFRKKLLGVF